MTTLVNEFQAW